MYSQYRRDLVLAAPQRTSAHEAIPRAPPAGEYVRGNAARSISAGQRPSEWFTVLDFGAAPMHGDAHAPVRQQESALERLADEWHIARRDLELALARTRTLEQDRRTQIITQKPTSTSAAALAAATTQTLRPVLDANAATFASMDEVLGRVQRLQSEQALRQQVLFDALRTLGTHLVQRQHQALDRRLMAAWATRQLASAWAAFLGSVVEHTMREIVTRQLAAHQLVSARPFVFGESMAASLVVLWEEYARTMHETLPLALRSNVDEMLAYRVCALQCSDVAQSVQYSYLAFARAVDKTPLLALSPRVAQWLGLPLAPSTSNKEAATLYTALVRSLHNRRVLSAKLTLETLDALVLRTREHNWLVSSPLGAVYTALYEARGMPASGVLDDGQQQQHREDEPMDAWGPMDTDDVVFEEEDYYRDDDAAAPERGPRLDDGDSPRLGWYAR